MRAPAPWRLGLPGLGLVEVVVQDPSEAPALGGVCGCIGTLGSSGLKRAEADVVIH